MNTKTLKIFKLIDAVQTPRYESAGAAGFDIRAYFWNQDEWGAGSMSNDFSFTLKAGERAKIPTGLKLVIAPGYELQVRPRSGLAFKNGISLTNSPGTIDSDYRGELQILIINHGSEDFTIRNGDRIAQGVLAPVIQAEFEIITEMPSESLRGAGGFGSTGVK